MLCLSRESIRCWGRCGYIISGDKMQRRRVFGFNEFGRYVIAWKPAQWQNVIDIYWFRSLWLLFTLSVVHASLTYPRCVFSGISKSFSCQSVIAYMLGHTKAWFLSAKHGATKWNAVRKLVLWAGCFFNEELKCNFFNYLMNLFTMYFCLETFYIHHELE